MSESRVRENRTHGSKGGRWQSAAPLRRTRNLRASVRYQPGTTNSQRPTSPFAVWCDETNEPLAAMLRPGNAGANNTNDHLELFDAAIDALPSRYRAVHMVGDHKSDVAVATLVRADSAGATHGFVRAILEANAEYTIGYAIDGRVRDALLRPRRRLVAGRRD